MSRGIVGECPVGRHGLRLLAWCQNAVDADGGPGIRAVAGNRDQQNQARAVGSTRPATVGVVRSAGPNRQDGGDPPVGAFGREVNNGAQSSATTSCSKLGVQRPLLTSHSIQV